MGAHKLLGNRQAKAGATVAHTATERFEQIFQCLGRDTRAGIMDSYLMLAFGFADLDPNFARTTAGGDCFGGIAQQIGQDAVELLRIGLHCVPLGDVDPAPHRTRPGTAAVNVETNGHSHFLGQRPEPDLA